MITPFQCVNCNASLAVVDGPTVTCRYCGAINQVPKAYREELRLARDLDETTQGAIKEWAKLDQMKAPRWWFVGATSTPFALLLAGLGCLLTLGVLRTVNITAIPWLVAVSVWIPLVAAEGLAAKVGMRNLLVSEAARVGIAFAAIPPRSFEESPNCRQCGAPLTVEPDDILVRCLYCGTESIVRLDSLKIQSLHTRVGTAQASLAQAMAVLSKRADLAAVETRGRVYVIAGLLVLPLVWSFAVPVQSSYWSLFIALDVWVLGICVFWNVREGFLLPVAIEELDALKGPLKADPCEMTTEHDGPVERVAGIRGWYDHSFDVMNYLLPVSVALLFVAIEILVLTSS